LGSFVFVFCLSQNKDDLTTLMMKVFSDGLEGLVLKDTNVTPHLCILTVDFYFNSSSSSYQHSQEKLLQMFDGSQESSVQESLHVFLQHRVVV